MDPLLEEPRSAFRSAARVAGPVKSADQVGCIGGRQIPRTAGAHELRQFKRCRDALKRELKGPIAGMIQEQMGLDMHVLWHGPCDAKKSAQFLDLCPALRNAGLPDGKIDAHCPACLDQNWPADLAAVKDEQEVVCPCGLTAFRVAVRIGNIPVPLTLALQAHVKNRHTARRRAISPAKFRKATALLRLLKRDLEMTLRALEAEEALAQSHRVMSIRMESGAANRLPSDHAAPTIRPTRTGRSGRVINQMIKHVNDHFHRPLALVEVADAMGMNASYLSDLFSRHLGMTFHQYLVEVRMAKARELLLDPHRRVCEVACAVGYASADHFRHAFKQHAGVPPSAWLETLA